MSNKNKLAITKLLTLRSNDYVKNYDAGVKSPKLDHAAVIKPNQQRKFKKLQIKKL